MQFVELAATSAAVTAVSGRRAKIDLLADTLRRLGPDEVEAGAAYLAGELRQRQIGVGWAAVRDVPGPAEAPSQATATTRPEPTVGRSPTRRRICPSLSTLVNGINRNW